MGGVALLLLALLLAWYLRRRLHIRLAATEQHAPVGVLSVIASLPLGRSTPSGPSMTVASVNPLPEADRSEKALTSEQVVTQPEPDATRTMIASEARHMRTELQVVQQEIVERATRSSSEENAEVEILRRQMELMRVQIEDLRNNSIAEGFEEPPPRYA